MSSSSARLPLTRRGALLGLGGAFLAACSRARLLAKGETGRVRRVIDGDLLILDSGLDVRLAEIEAPAASLRSSAPFGEAVRQMLRHAAEGKTAYLYYGGLTRDRYDRALAHVIVAGADKTMIWLNGYMVRQGGARVRSWPDNAARVRKLYTLEEEARNARRGLWALDAYRVRSPLDAEPSPGFTIVEGPLLAFRRTEGFGRAVFSRNGLALEAPVAWGEPETDLVLKQGAPVRIRGRIDAGAMRLSHWGQIETPPR